MGRGCNFTTIKGKTKQQETNHLEQTPRISFDSGERIRGKHPQRQTKKHPVDIIRILNFRTGPKGRKNARFKSNFEGKALNSTCKWSTNFLVKNQKRTRRPEESEQPFLQTRLRKQRPSVHPS